MICTCLTASKATCKRASSALHTKEPSAEAGAARNEGGVQHAHVVKALCCTLLSLALHFSQNS